MVAKEAPEGTRVSLRSIDGPDVGALAQSLGGGGHRYASGFTSARPIGEVVASVREALTALGPGPALSR